MRSGHVNTVLGYGSPGKAHRNFMLPEKNAHVAYWHFSFSMRLAE
jgi:hypothetical protein